MALKVEEKLYEIQVVEEEWRSDPDWWLTDDDRRSESQTDSEHSSEQMEEEDQEWINFEICDEEDDIINEKQSMKESKGNSNSNFKHKEEEGVNGHTEVRGEGRGEEMNGPTKEIGLRGIKETGLGDIMDLDGIFIQRELRRTKKKGPTETSEMGAYLNRELEMRVLGGKRRRQIKDCYPESLTKIWANKTHRTSARAKQRQRGRAKMPTGAENKVNIGYSCSISDGCIVNRNRVLQRKMILHEVRRMMSVGKRLGFQFQENEGEVQSRLLELEERDVAGEQKGNRG
ncbi:hypothetical protein SLA2020_342020 [Shorea laevis]